MKAFTQLACLVLLPVSILAQGNLNPTTPPAPSMKRLDQVEPRKPVDALHTPGNDTSEFIIRTAGSYYLTGDVVTAKPIGILILIESVTLDLNGFLVTRSGALGSGTGILIGGSFVTVRNGQISRWASGIKNSDSGIREGIYEQLIVSQCQQNGIEAGRDWLVERCIASRNGNVGIAAGSGSVRVNNCVASNNGAGMSFTSGGNVTGSIASGNKGHGIFGNGVTIAGCTVDANEQHGVNVGADSVVRENKISGNGVDSNNVGAGVNVFADRNRIIGNTILGNDKGIFVSSRANVIDGNSIRGAAGPGIEITLANGKNIIIRNQAGDNGGSYTSIAAGNNVAPITTPENATNPYGNILN